MSAFKPKVISLSKKPGQTFGFYLREEHGEEGHLIRCLEMGGPAELAGIKDGDRILRVNGTFVDGLSHSEVADMVKNCGASVTFHILDEASYKKAKAKGIKWPDQTSQTAPVGYGLPKDELKPKLCYLVKTNSDFGFSLHSVKGEPALSVVAVIPGGVADRAGVKVKDRLLEINGENVEDSSHDQVENKIRQAGNSVMFLLVEEKTDEYFKKKRIEIGTRLATVKYLPHKPRIVTITKGYDGYGFMLWENCNKTGHFITAIDRGSPAEKAGVKEMDRIVAVNGKEVDSCTHEQVVDMIRQSGNKCCFLMVDSDTDQMYNLGQVSPMLFYEEMEDSNSPPSYIEAINSPSVQSSTPREEQERKEELKPKLCKMEKTSASFGFHLNGVKGMFGQYVKEVVKGGAADRAGMEDDDVVVEVNGVNVEQKSYEEVVEMIQCSGSTLEMLVAKKSVYEQLTASGVTITPLLLGATSNVQVHSADTAENSKETHEDESRPETPTEAARERSSSSSSEESIDEKF